MIKREHILILIAFSFIACFLACLIAEMGPVEGKLIGKQYIPPYDEVVDDYTTIDYGNGVSITMQSGSHVVHHEAEYYLTIETEEGKIKSRYVSREIFDLANVDEHIKLE